MDDLQFNLEFGRYYMWIDDFKKNKGKFPKLLNEVYLDCKRDFPEYIKFIEQIYFIDVFSKKKEWVGYFPIYNSDDSEIISYLILSAGIDGKFDNVNNPSNKLHLDDWKQKLKLYNPNEFDDGVNIFSDEFDMRMRPCHKGRIEERPYDAKEEKSGNKDLLIFVYHLAIACNDE